MNAPRDRLIGARIDQRYRIDAVIARGGMSTVYMGLDLRLDRPIAIKVMDPKYAEDRQFVSRFEFEARSVAKLKDPGLVAVYDQGVDGELAFLVMELVTGGTLRELLAERGPMPPHAVAAVMAPVLGALGTAHRAGLVHRDVKPENILISEGGEVKIADFGLVRAIAAASVTSSSVILGTAAYLSPEQVEYGTADPRSDVYSSGIMIYELLTGDVPFTGDTAISLAYQRLHNDVPPPSEAIAGVPPELDEFVARATARDPEQRFEDGESMGAALAELSDRLHLPAFTVPAPRSSAEQRAAAAMYDAQRNQPHIPSAAEPTGMVGPAGPMPMSDLPPPVADGPAPTLVEPAFGLGAGPAHRVAGPADGRHATRAETMHEPLPEEVAPRRRRRTRTYVLVAVIAILALLLALGGWWLGAGRFTNVPSVSGLDKTAAVSALEHAGLEVSESGTYSNDIAENKVTGVEPPSGARVSRFSSVTLKYSLGRPVVPQFQAGASPDTVDKLLRDHGLTPVHGPRQFSESVPEGGVVGLSPTPGTRMTVGAQVTVVASAGNHPVTIPDVRGQSEDDARTAITRAGLTVSGTKQQFDSGVDAGRVAGTDPSGQVNRGGSVTLLISNALTVPNVTGKTRADAQQALQDAGFDVQVSGDDGDSSLVTSVSPPVGSHVDPANNTVTLTVSRKVVVPSVTGMSVGQAKSTLQGMGLQVKVQSILSSDSSQVIWQSPSGGSQVEPGRTVTVTAIP
ncbi:Stk1 family PASTA domain-containing Ser/Thr kinase [Tsukamurella sp. 8F]|uniref:Stk1 family PASTA domain-containing Ser/Thr kinase n=1 Tax=unclassified Tsukamurella TaxID=2633480 RepID=UPI0023B9048D|nr:MULTISPECIES: Stk1 family PASTA domain-containing Ser/Thr kinase [unclassified Tsukamurella]MDF0532022.1 Stk1 family PASTA domain-containing Ser/Thr kinase [Tsukamurella sp. 8J]MDF0588427.1 Stk1 family PASTA domain-containing Ser/Thr kinase [Tsukamurella sp. 8F]